MKIRELGCELVEIAGFKRIREVVRICAMINWGYVVAQLVEALGVLDSRWCHCNFSLT